MRTDVPRLCGYHPKPASGGAGINQTPLCVLEQSCGKVIPSSTSRYKLADSRIFTPMLSEDKKKELIEVLSARLRRNGKTTTCPMCGHTQFTIADAYVTNVLQDDVKSVSIGGPAIPALAILCSNCGFISQHALGMLGLLSSAEKSDDKK